MVCKFFYLGRLVLYEHTKVVFSQSNNCSVSGLEDSQKTFHKDIKYGPKTVYGPAIFYQQTQDFPRAEP